MDTYRGARQDYLQAKPLDLAAFQYQLRVLDTKSRVHNGARQTGYDVWDIELPPVLLRTLKVSNCGSLYTSKGRQSTKMEKENTCLEVKVN